MNSGLRISKKILEILKMLKLHFFLKFEMFFFEKWKFRKKFKIFDFVRRTGNAFPWSKNSEDEFWGMLFFLVFFSEKKH